jgi:hypothetical protein
MTANTDLDADSLIAAAIEQTGFSDFGPFPFREGLEVLLQTYDRNLQDPAGRERCSGRVLNLLATRLRCEHVFATNPEIFEQEIIAPIFITGLPRSGTSALLNLMVAAPENRGILQWEVQFPDPWPGSKPGEEDPRYRPLADALAKFSDPQFKKIHYVDADTPEECVLLHALAFNGVQLGMELNFEPYRSWLLAQDLEPMYAYQKRILQLLNWRLPGQRWLLKAPAHMWGIESILKVFPDARFIWCHRDPQAVVPSINSMNKAVMGMYAGDCSHLNMHEIGRSVMEWYATSLETGLASRAALPPELFADCSQQELVEQPMALLERLYREFDLPMSEDARAALQAHIDANPKGKHGRHEYDLSTYGLDKDTIDQRFAFYTQTGRWPISG